MSLIHWWPLTEDLKDKINNITLSGTWDKFTNDGKMGSCHGTNDGVMITTTVTIPNTFSFAFWVKNNDLTYPKTTAPIQFGAAAISKTVAGWDYAHRANGTAPDNTNYRVTLSDGVHPLLNFYWSHSAGNPMDLLGEWYHVAIVINYEKRKINLYINGVSYGEQNITSSFNGCGGTRKLTIGRVQGWKLDGYMNDIRIYDHALSKAEIQELKKSLVIHYTFDDILAESTTNIMPINYQKGQFITGASDNNYDSAGSFTVNTTTHGTYTLSGYYKIGTTDTATNPRISLNAKYSENSNAITICQFRPIIRDDEWHYFSLTGITDSTKTLQNLSGWFFDYSSPGNGRICYAKDIQLELKDHATPYTVSNRSEMLCNEVGLHQHNNIQNINLSLDAAVGKYALNCNNTCINLPSTGDIAQGATASCWIKTLTYPTVNQVVFADYNSKLAFGFYGTQNAIISCGSYPVGIINNIQAKWKQNAWNHIAITRTTTNQFICYLNNEQLTLSNSTNNWTTLSDCAIGCRNNGTYNTYFNGLIDDFRLYYTQLSLEDIKDLYNCGGRISNLGDALTGSFIEEAAITKVNKNHTIETNEIYEQILPDGYQQLEYIQSNGSQYIKTGIYSNDKITEIKAHYYNTTTDNSQILFGMYDGTQYAYFDYREGNSNCRIAWYNNVIQTEIPFTIGERNTSLKTSGRNYTYTLNTQSFSSVSGADPAGNTEMYLFAYNKRGTPGYSARCKMYNFKISIDNILQRDFIPARRISDNALGLYDIINNQFYINAGSGEFIAGPTLTTGQASMLRASGLTAREIIEI